MHRTLTDATTRGGIKPSNPFVRGKAPKLVVDLTDYGYQYAGIRPLGDTGDAHPRLSLHPAVPSDPPVVSETGLALDAGHIWVPMDDDTTMVFNWSSARKTAN
jgi:phthalate 4,5-dioxygenase oxygenase subunit